MQYKNNKYATPKENVSKEKHHAKSLNRSKKHTRACDNKKAKLMLVYNLQTLTTNIEPPPKGEKPVNDALVINCVQDTEKPENDDDKAPKGISNLTP